MLFQALLTALVMFNLPVKPEVRMLTENHPELSCQQPPLGFTILLTCNLLLLFACAVFGFLTRKLPENFNEAWYIFVSVSTEVFIWLVFLPTNFISISAVYQVAMMATCLVLNATITLSCFFVPKVYAAYFVAESKIKFAVTSVSARIASVSN